jgi:hypothetical protein
MPALSQHSNVDTEALAILKDKGWQVWIDRHDGEERYWCERDGWDLNADSLTALLGLVAIFDYRAPDAFREYWWRDSSVPYSRELATAPQPYVSVIKRGRG